MKNNREKGNLQKWIRRNKINKGKKDKITIVQNGNYSTKMCPKVNPKQLWWKRMSLHNTFSSAPKREASYGTKSPVCLQAFYHFLGSSKPLWHWSIMKRSICYFSLG